MPRKKKRAAWGSVTDLGGGCFRIRYYSNGIDGYKRRSKTIRNATRKQAEQRRAELMLAHSDDAPCPTVGEVWERWVLPTFERRVDEGDMAPQTLRQYASAWRRHASPRWADVPCDSVRPLAVQQWLDSLGHSEAVSATKVLKMAMDVAVRYEVVTSNPFRERYLMPSKSTVSRRDSGIWTLDGLGEVWRAVHGSWLEPAFLLAAFGGLRVGESLGVRAEDVSAGEVCMVEVRRQISNKGSTPTERLKTPQSRRVVPIPGRAGVRLAELAEAGGWLTSDGMGGHQNRYRLGRTWDALVPDGLRHPFQNLRNSYETNMRWAMRVQPWAIEAILGHAGKGVTGAYYDRPTPDMLAGVVLEAYAANPYDAGWNWLD